MRRRAQLSTVEMLADNRKRFTFETLRMYLVNLTICHYEWISTTYSTRTKYLSRITQLHALLCKVTMNRSGFIRVVRCCTRQLLLYLHCKYLSEYFEAMSSRHCVPSTVLGSPLNKEYRHLKRDRKFLEVVVRGTRCDCIYYTSAGGLRTHALATDVSALRHAYSTGATACVRHSFSVVPFRCYERPNFSVFFPTCEAFTIKFPRQIAVLTLLYSAKSIGVRCYEYNLIFVLNKATQKGSLPLSLFMHFSKDCCVASSSQGLDIESYRAHLAFMVRLESMLQHINGLRILHKTNDPYITSTRDLIEESKTCLKSLKLTPANSFLNNRENFVDPRKVRDALREKEFENWCTLQQKGKGVILNKEFPPANSWIRNHKGLTLSEWIDALKMVGYVAPVRAVPGRSRDGTRCRRCLSFCSYSEALYNIRHHAVRSMLAEALKEVGFTVHQEVQGLATQGSVRRIDIIAIKNNSAYIFDPTIRFETHADQPHEVDSEKKRIYEPTIPFYKDKYSLSHIDVIGLMVGARGTIPSFFANKCKNLGLTHSIVKEIAISALKGSVQILRNHLYGSGNGNFKLS
ncbi:hypothetical protein ANN_13844 [Periplaneta americana]|uniref:Uncharacterized protein n=1 Tax=Periplaneta americana TaxID=6978 RepID=A0ABQ8SUN7_PERAM|nr:hypothetical protein ANN_13844 [Periplaneta americana]